MVNFENPSQASEVERIIAARAAGAADPLAAERLLLLRLARRNGFDANPDGIALELIRLYASATPNQTTA